MQRVFELLHKHRVVTVTALIAILAVLGAGLARLDIDNALEVWFVEDDPALVNYRQFLEDFGNDEVIVTAVSGVENPLAEETLARIDALTRRHQSIDGVERVLSLTSLPLLRGTEEGARFAPAAEKGAIDLEAIRSAVKAGGLANRFVGRDGKSLLVFTWLSSRAGIDAQRPRILDELRAGTVEALAGSGLSAHHAGMGVMYDAINRATLGEGSLFIGLSYVVIALALYVLTRSWRWTLLAAVTVGAANVALLGLMGWLGRPLTMYSMTLPSLVLVLGIAGVLHLINHEGNGQAGQWQKGFFALLGAVAVPTLVNTLTESAGFLSLATARTAITRDFGVFAGVGVLLCFGFFLIVFSVAGPWVGAPRSSTRLHRALERISVESCRLSLRRPRWVIASAALVTVVAGFGVLRLDPDTLAIDFLPDTHGFREDSARVEAAAGPYLPLELVLTLPEGKDWKDAGFLRQLEAASRALVDQGLGRPLSVVDVLRELVARLEERPVAETRLPESDEQVRELAGWVEQKDDAGFLGQFIADGGRKVRLTTAVPMSTALTFKKHALAAKEQVQALMGKQARVEFGGYLPLNWRMAEGVVDDQVSSFGMAFVVIFFAILAALRNWRLALLAIPSNVIPVALTLGLMGYCGIRLDIATVTIAAAVLGIVVDDTVHTLHQVHTELREGRALPAALLEVSRRTSVGVLSTSLIICAGFGVIALSSVHSVAEIGLLTALSVGTAAVADLLVLPALVLWVLADRGSKALERPAAASLAS